MAILYQFLTQFIFLTLAFSVSSPINNLYIYIGIYIIYITAVFFGWNNKVIHVLFIYVYGN